MYKTIRNVVRAGIILSLLALTFQTFAADRIIKSRAEAIAYLATAADEYPLNSLPYESAREFIESLVFTDYGVGSYNYEPLRDNVNAEQAYDLLKLFGAEKTLGLIPDIEKTIDPASERRDIISLLSNKRMAIMDGARDYTCDVNGLCYRATGAICPFTCRPGTFSNGRENDDELHWASNSDK